MKVFYKYMAILIMACGFVCLFSSCDDDDEVKKTSSEIIGKWKYEDEEFRSTIQFKADNICIYTEYFYDSYYDEYEYEIYKGIYEYDRETKMIYIYFEDDEVWLFRYMGSFLLDLDCGDRWYKIQ